MAVAGAAMGAAVVMGCVDVDSLPPARGAEGANKRVRSEEVVLPNGEKFPGCPEHTVLRGYPISQGALATYCVTEIEPAVRQGPFVSFYPSGKLLAKGWYQEGNPDGDFVTYHESGEVLSAGAYVRGTRNGSWRFGRSDGKPILEEVVNLGQRTSWIEYDYEKGALVAFESFAARPGKRPVSEGRAGFVHPDGDTLSGAFSEDRAEGVWEEKTAKGAVVLRLRMVKGFAEGKVDVLDPDGGRPLVDGEMLRSLPQGPWAIAFPSGKPRAELKYDRGMLRSAVVFYEGGQKRLSSEFTDGAPSGTWTAYHPSGEIAVSGAFSGGARQGTWRAADAQGKTIAEGLYDAGLLIEGSDVELPVVGAFGLFEVTGPLLRDLRMVTTGRGGAEAEQRSFAECVLFGDAAEKCLSLDWENAAGFHEKDDAAAIERRDKLQALACGMGNPAACARIGKRAEAAIATAKDRKREAMRAAGLYQKACDLSAQESAWKAREPAAARIYKGFHSAEACVWLGRMLEKGDVKSKALSAAALYRRACAAGVEAGCAAEAAAAEAESSAKTKAKKPGK